MMFLPMIDMKPTDMTCVNSALHFVSEHSRRYGITPVITFDQPLWWKATTIVVGAQEDSPLRSVILRLWGGGGFHIMMSFLGSIGHLMAGTGLQELLEVIFAGNTVAHILSGKAVARAIRDHLLLESVLHTLLLCNVFETKLSLSSDNVPVELNAIADLYDDLVSSKTTMQEVESSVELQALQVKLDMFTDTLGSKYLTAKLWLEYMEMVNIIQGIHPIPTNRRLVSPPANTARYAAIPGNIWS